MSPHCSLLGLPPFPVGPPRYSATQSRRLPKKTSSTLMPLARLRRCAVPLHRSAETRSRVEVSFYPGSIPRTGNRCHTAYCEAAVSCDAALCSSESRLQRNLVEHTDLTGGCTGRLPWGFFPFHRYKHLRPLPEPQETPSESLADSTNSLVPPSWSFATSTVYSANALRAYCISLPVVGFAAFLESAPRQSPDKYTSFVLATPLPPEEPSWLDSRTASPRPVFPHGVVPHPSCLPKLAR